MKQRNLCPIDDTVVADLAREADVDERTVIRRLAGLRVRGRAGRRVDRVLQARMAATPDSKPPLAHGPSARSGATIADDPIEKSAAPGETTEQAEKGQKHGFEA
jgi:hypothetical protein